MTRALGWVTLVIAALRAVFSLLEGHPVTSGMALAAVIGFVLIVYGQILVERGLPSADDS